MFVALIVTLVTTLVVYFYYFHKKAHNFFNERGIKYVPGVPVFGNLTQSAITWRHMIQDFDAVYKAYPDERYVGFIEALSTMYLLRDPELIKTISVKDFDHFVDHKHLFNPDLDCLCGNNILMLKGNKWRDMRATLGPAFTGAKMKLVTPLMQAVTDHIVEYLGDFVGKEIELGVVMSRFTSDNIASAAFGLETNSFKDWNDQLYANGKKLTPFRMKQKISLILNALFPSLKQILKYKFLPDDMTNFFQKFALDIIEHRIKNNVTRPDMVQTLIESMEGTQNQEKQKTRKIRDWSKIDLISQVFAIYIAGFESSSGTLTTACHELALHPDIQEKLYQEIRAFKEKHGALTYDNIAELKYLECVINETLRKWSPLFIMNRQCTKPYVLPPPREGGKEIPINVGEVLFVSLNSIHMDPKYYPNPEVFDPDRFDEKNKHKLTPDTFLPFGVGPRICIGMRFAYLQMKILMFNLLLNYKIVKSERTLDPIVLDTTNFLVKVRGGSWVKMEDRKQI